MSREIKIGVLGAGRGASVDGHGRVRTERAGWELEWWIGADDRWHVPTTEVAVRQTLLDAMPVVQTSLRVPGGDAVQLVYGAPATDSGAVAEVEVANESPAPFVLALVVNGASAVDLAGATVFVDGRPGLRTIRPPSRWAMTADGSTRDVVTNGAASDAPFAARRDRGAGLVAAFLYPVAHRTAARAAVALGARGLGAVDVAGLPGADDVARGWRAQLDRGMRVELPEPALQVVHDTARAALLLEGQAWRVDPLAVATLEDWGFDAETADAWTRLTGRQRRHLTRRVPPRTSWADVRGRAGRDDVAFLAALRNVLVREHDGSVVLIDEWPAEGRGQAFDVRDAPTRSGPVSFSVRWHGDRPALLWDAPGGLRLCAPGLDPSWSTEAARGEALLGASAIGDAHGDDLPRA